MQPSIIYIYPSIHVTCRLPTFLPPVLVDALAVDDVLGPVALIGLLQIGAVGVEHDPAPSYDGHDDDRDDNSDVIRCTHELYTRTIKSQFMMIITIIMIDDVETVLCLTALHHHYDHPITIINHHHCHHYHNHHHRLPCRWSSLKSPSYTLPEL